MVFGRTRKEQILMSMMFVRYDYLDKYMFSWKKNNVLLKDAVFGNTLLEYFPYNLTI